MSAATYPVTPSVARNVGDRQASASPDTVKVHEVATSRVRWSVRRSGTGPVVLLLHGTGSAKQSWSAVSRLLEQHFTVIAPDLPGHAESTVLNPAVMSLSAMAHEAGELLRALDADPGLIVGHSAGAALAVRMVLDGCAHPEGIVAINGAFVTFGGALDRVFAPLAGLFATSSIITDGLARKARDPRAVERVIKSTGSSLDRDGIARYSKLLQQPSHLEATFAMMANWDLRTLRRDMRNLQVPLHLLVADNDLAVSPRQARGITGICPHAQISRLAGVGHVAHEENPEPVVHLILQDAQQLGLR